MIAVPDAKEDRTRSKAVVLIFALLFGITVLLATLSLPIGVYTVLFTTLAQGYGAATLVYTFVWAGPVPVTLPVAVPVGLLFVLEIAVYMILLAYAFAHKSAFAAFSAGFRSGVSFLLSNDLVVVLISVGFYIFSVLIIDAFVTAGGAPIGGPSESNALFYFVAVTVSPLREELGFRVGIIGVVACLIALGGSRTGLLRALWRPSTVYERDVVRTGKVFAVIAALVASSAIFGLWHVLSGTGWDIGKLPGVIFGGLILGYLYIRYGFHVAVLTHWGIDYFGTAFAFFGQGAYGILWTSDPGYLLQQIVSIDLIMGIGLFSFLLVIYLGAARLLRSRKVVPSGDAGSS